MKKNLVTVLFAIAISTVNAQWTRLTQGLPEKSGGRCFAVKNSMLMAGDRTGYYFSMDNGNSWSEKKLEMPYTPNISQICVEKDYMIVSGSGGTSISYDNGATWKPFLSNKAPFASIDNIVTSNNDVYAESGDGLFYSDNLGKTFKNITAGTIKAETYLNDDGEARSLVYIYNVTLIGSQLIIGTENGIYISTDKGANWKAMNNGLPRKKSISTFSSAGSTFYVYVYEDGIYSSANGGESWAKVESLPKKTNLLSMATSGFVIFASLYQKGIYYSNDNGRTWTQMITGLPKKITCRSLIVNDGKLFAGTYDEGIFTYDLGTIPGAK